MIPARNIGATLVCPGCNTPYPLTAWTKGALVAIMCCATPKCELVGRRFKYAIPQVMLEEITDGGT